MLAINVIRGSICRTHSRGLHLTAFTNGPDSRTKRQGHLEKKDILEGEHGAVGATTASFSLVDDKLMDTVINNMKFKDIPVLHLKCTRNNTKMTLRRADGIVLATKSAGTEGFKNCRKGTTVAAQAVANRVLTYAKDYDVNMARLVFDGLGPGRNAAYKVIEMSDLRIVSLSDRTEADEPWIRRPRGAKRI